MSYQNYSSQPTMAGTQSTTMIHSGQPVAAQQRPYNPFAAKANATKKLGIVQVVMGTISLVLGIAMIPIAPFYFGSLSGGGIWSGIFIIISGALCIAAGSNPDGNGTKCGALTMSIISILFISACGIMNFVGFAAGVSCRSYCWWDSYQQRNICNNDCEGFEGAGPWLSLLISIMMVFLFFITLFSAIYTGQGCCSGGNLSSGYVVSQPILAPGGGITVSNYQATSHPGSYPHQGYAPPTSGYPPSSIGYPPSSTGYAPPTSAGYPPSSNGPVSTGYPASSGGYPHTSYAPSSSHQPYPSQGQQYTQASAAQGGVTYGTDYSQQKAGVPETSLGEAPPPYNPN